MDNMETVLDDRIRTFFERLPSGSKVLITSRIGLGAFEYPMKLQPMEQKDAVDLLRALAKVRGVKDLARIDNPKLAAYCTRMKNSPGFIKWFVSAVQTGKRPEEVLAKPDIFLDFCMSNVYNYLSATGRKVLRSMLCLPGRYSQAELAFLNDMEALDLQSAIHELLRTNMVIMSSISKGSSFETQYEVSDMARNYLSRHHPVEAKEFERLTKKKRQLVAATEEIQAEAVSNPYSLYSLTVRSRSDLIVAKYLVEAMRHADRGNFSLAESLIAKARNLAPQYFEVHRVEAVIKVKQGNYSAALSSYEAAIDLEPNSAPVRKWFGSFLVRYMDDNDGAMTQFNEASRLDPNSFDVQLEIARTALYLRDFDQSTAVVETLKARPDVSAHNRRKVYDLYLQCFSRRADHLYSQKDYVSTAMYLEKLKEAYQNCPITLLDERMKEKLQKSLPLAKACAQHLTDQQSLVQIYALIDWMSIQLGVPSPFISGPSGLERLKGVVMKLIEHKSYGYILSDDHREFFFHRNEMINPTDWIRVVVGTKVAFVPGTDNKGLRASVVTVEGHTSLGKTMSLDGAILNASKHTRVKGQVVRLPFGRSFGFIESTEGQEYFFHRNDLNNPRSWSRLKIGDEVEFALGTNDHGPCAKQIDLQ